MSKSDGDAIAREGDRQPTRQVQYEFQTSENWREIKSEKVGNDGEYRLGPRIGVARVYCSTNVSIIIRRWPAHD
jgi:hypothetical protein